MGVFRCWSERGGNGVINGCVISRLSLMARLLQYTRHPSHLNGGRHPPLTQVHLTRVLQIRIQQDELKVSQNPPPTSPQHFHASCSEVFISISLIAASETSPCRVLKDATVTSSPPHSRRTHTQSQNVQNIAASCHSWCVNESQISNPWWWSVVDGREWETVAS